MPSHSFRIALLVLLLNGPALVAQQAPDSFDFLAGDWASRKDGFSFTLRVTPILDGLAYQATQTLDENNRTVMTAIYSFDRASRLWTRTQFNQLGERATFVGVPVEEGLALEMTSFAGREMQPVRARLFFPPPEPDGTWIMDWQSREEADSPWQPREVPFIHSRVDRPDPPQGDGRIAFISNRTGNWEIFTMNPDGSDVRNLSNHPEGDHAPRWIAGGTRLAFRSQRSEAEDGWSRWEVDADGTDPEEVDLPGGLGNPEAGTFPEVHPTGSYLVFAAEREGELEMYVSRFDGGGERPLAHAPGPDYRPKWSPDGQSVLFISERDGNPEIYRVDTDGANLTRLTENPGNDRYARWSPDGRWIAFASDRGDQETLDLYLMRADGSQVHRLTEDTAEDGEPSWSPDGSRIVFRCNGFGKPEICVVGVANGAITRLTNNDAYDGEPVWSPVAR